MEASTAKFVLLDERRAHAELCRPDSGGVSGATATQNYDVKLMLGQVGSPSVLKYVCLNMRLGIARLSAYYL